MDERAVKQGGRASASERIPPEHELALSEVPLFRSLTRRHLRRVARLAQRRRYRDEVVVRAGARGDAFFVILDGQARLDAPGGQTDTLTAGDAFGELALLDGAPRAATVTAVGELVTVRIARADFTRLVADEPAIDVALIQGVVAMIRKVGAGTDAHRTMLLRRVSADTLGVDVSALREGLVPADPASAANLPDTSPTSSGADLEKPTSLGWLSAMRQVPLFHELQGRQLSRVIRLAGLRRYGAGVTVVRANARGDSFHIILDGRAGVVTAEGHERVLRPGESFGELALIDGSPRAATVTALDDLTTARFGRPAFFKLLHEEPTIAAGVLRGLVRIVRDIEADTTSAPSAVE